MCAHCYFLKRRRGGNISLWYLAGEGHLDGHGDHLGQETPVEGHHEGHRVVVGEHQRHLVQWRNTECKGYVLEI